jgi:hypothetical protein
MTVEESWVSAMRAQALAKLLLTERDDLEVIDEPPGVGCDLLVRVRAESLVLVPEFTVEVKGTRRITDTVTLRDWLSSIRVTGAIEGLPWCLFVFQVETRQGHYCWLNEPLISENAATLRSVWEPRSISRNLHQQETTLPLLVPLDSQALDGIVSQVVAWTKTREQSALQHAQAS